MDERQSINQSTSKGKDNFYFRMLKEQQLYEMAKELEDHLANEKNNFINEN